MITMRHVHHVNHGAAHHPPYPAPTHALPYLLAVPPTTAATLLTALDEIMAEITEEK